MLVISAQCIPAEIDSPRWRARSYVSPLGLGQPATVSTTEVSDPTALPTASPIATPRIAARSQAASRQPSTARSRNLWPVTIGRQP